jgi:hypothetical protein
VAGIFRELEGISAVEYVGMDGVAKVSCTAFCKLPEATFTALLVGVGVAVLLPN